MFRVTTRFAPAAAAFGVLALGSFGLTAHGAERVPETKSVTVLYGDLDLNTQAGMTKLHTRLRAAAREVCDVREQRQLAEAIAARSCYRQTYRAATDSANSLPSQAAVRVAASARDDAS